MHGDDFGQSTLLYEMSKHYLMVKSAIFLLLNVTTRFNDKRRLVSIH